MINDRTIQSCIEEAGDIAGAGFIVSDPEGRIIAKAGPIKDPDIKELTAFAKGKGDDKEISGQKFLKISVEDELSYILVATEGEGGYISAYLLAAQIRNLINAYSDKVDRNSFFQDLLLDNLLPADITTRAAKLHVDGSVRRCVFVIEPVSAKENDLMEIVKELFFAQSGDHVTAVDEDRIVVIKALTDKDKEDELEDIADMLVDMSESEAMSDVRVAYGTVAKDLRGLSSSYKEARMALEVSRIFYPLKRVARYENLGVGRLIYQLPVNLCRIFVKEIFGDDIPEEIDEETLTTVNRFFENNLNVSETSRQLFIHRNTLIYRIEKLQKATGLDVRVFDDALTLKIALMVVDYLRDQDG